MELAGQISLYLLTPLIFEVVAGQSVLRIKNAYTIVIMILYQDFLGSNGFH